jgi:hypothetical protein
MRRCRALRRKVWGLENRKSLIEAESQILEARFRAIAPQRMVPIGEEVDRNEIRSVIGEIGKLAKKGSVREMSEDIHRRCERLVRACDDVRERREAVRRQWNIYLGNTTLEGRARSAGESREASLTVEQTTERLKRLRETERAGVDGLSEFLEQLQRTPVAVRSPGNTLVMV